MDRMAEVAATYAIMDETVGSDAMNAGMLLFVAVVINPSLARKDSSFSKDIKSPGTTGC